MGEETGPGRAPVSAWSLAVIDPPEVDEFDLDLRLGELADHTRVHWLGTPLAAQTDPQCELPTGGKGAGTTCDTNDNTCGATCAGLDTCPHTQCGNTCPPTQCNTCPPTCQTCNTECDQATCDCHTNNPHVNTCHHPCQPQ